MRNHRNNHSNAPDMHYIVPGLPFYRQFGNNTEMIPGIVADLAGKCYRAVRRAFRRFRTISWESAFSEGPSPIKPDKENDATSSFARRAPVLRNKGGRI